MPFARVNPGDLIASANLDQIVDSLNGASGKGIPIAETSVNDATNYALSVQNLEATNSRALNVLKSDGTLLIRADVNGVNLGNTTVTGPSLTLPTASVPNAALGADVARANLLTNPGFEVWQRGNGPFTANYTADRWAIFVTGTDTFSVSKTTNYDNYGQAALAATFTLGTGTGLSRIYQSLTLADQPGIWGLPVSLSMRVRTSVANAVRIGVDTANPGDNFVYSAFHPGDGTYHTLTVFATALSSPQILQACISFSASCTAYIDNACLVVGVQPANYVPLHPADDWARCARYYEIIGETTGSLIVSQNNNSAGGIIRTTLSYKARKPVTPTVTKVGTWTVSNAGQPVVNTAGVDVVWVQVQATAAGDGYAYANTAGNCITVEANP